MKQKISISQTREIQKFCFCLVFSFSFFPNHFNFPLQSPFMYETKNFNIANTWNRKKKFQPCQFSSPVSINFFKLQTEKHVRVQNFNFLPFLRTQTEVQQHSHAALSVKQKFTISRTQSMEDWNFRLLVQLPSVGLGHIPTPSSIRIKKNFPSRERRNTQGGKI